MPLDLFLIRFFMGLLLKKRLLTSDECQRIEVVLSNSQDSWYSDELIKSLLYQIDDIHDEL